MQQYATRKPIDGYHWVKTPIKPGVFALSSSQVRSRAMSRNGFATHHVSPNDASVDCKTVVPPFSVYQCGHLPGILLPDLSLRPAGLVPGRDSIFTGGGTGTIRIKIPITSYKTY